MPEPPKLAAASPNLVALLQRLGVYGEDSGMPWWFSDVILPVAIVDAGQVTLQATAIPFPLGTPASAGELTAPAATTRLADTGALAAGQWNFFFTLGKAGSADGASYSLQRRNAADAANIWSQRMVLRNDAATGTGLVFVKIGPIRVILANNERIVVVVNDAAAVGSIHNANIWTQGPF
jgi:hypothetical protein